VSDLLREIEARKDDWPALKAFLLDYDWPPLPEASASERAIGDFDPGKNGWMDVEYAVTRGLLTRAQRDEIGAAIQEARRPRD
jgi:hypothetical protein